MCKNTLISVIIIMSQNTVFYAINYNTSLHVSEHFALCNYNTCQNSLLCAIICVKNYVLFIALPMLL